MHSDADEIAKMLFSILKKTRLKSVNSKQSITITEQKTDNW
jgi:hypothetical protein